jgi:hypothetical protein
MVNASAVRLETGVLGALRCEVPAPLSLAILAEVAGLFHWREGYRPKANRAVWLIENHKLQISRISCG